MHLYALDEKENLISAHQADKQTNYFCRECRCVVRCRGGFLRQVHFYHLEPNRTCRQSGKSLIHLQIQQYMQTVLPTSECELEKRFPLINRIADVVWEEKKLIFEIQCSPISAREIEGRNHDYQSLGYQVIWIMHDHLYNKNRLTAAEYFLQESPHYFTDMNAEGQGRIYDQCDWIEKGKRLKSMGSREVNISSHCLCKEQLFSNYDYPTWLKKRIQSWPIYFSGDFLDHLLMSKDVKAGEIGQETFIELEKSQTQLGLRERVMNMINFIMFPYRLMLHLIIEKLTR